MIRLCIGLFALWLTGCANLGQRYAEMGPCTRNGLYIGTGSGAVAGIMIAGNPLFLGAAQGALGYWIGLRAEDTLCAEQPIQVAEAPTPAQAGPAVVEVEAPRAVVYVDVDQPEPEPEAPVQALDYENMSEAQLEEQAQTFFAGVYVTVKFDYNTAILDERTLRRIGEVAEFMRYYPGSNVHVIGHTDGIGTESYNMNLSLQRAAGVADQIVQQGIPVERVIIEGRGESEPLADNDTEEGRALNRRVDITVQPSATEPVPPEPLAPTPAPDALPDVVPDATTEASSDPGSE